MILADCDTQHSSSEWISEALPEITVVRLANADAVLDQLPELGLEADFVIADGPGSQPETSRALLMWADLAILPCIASMFEARALGRNTAFGRQAQAIRKGPPEVIAVLNFVNISQRTEYRLLHTYRWMLGRPQAESQKLPFGFVATMLTVAQQSRSAGPSSFAGTANCHL